MEKVECYFELLPEEIMENILVLCGGFSYFAGQVCQKWKKICISRSRQSLLEECFSGGRLNFLKKICVGKMEMEILVDKNIGLAFVFRQFEVLNWIDSKGYNWERKHYHLAVEVGYLEFLTRVDKSKFFFPEESVARYAVKGGHLEVIQWLRKETFDSCIQVAEYAAYFGQIEILEWITNNIGLSGFLWEEAAMGGQFETLEWLKERNCPRIKLKFQSIHLMKNVEVIKWLLKERHEFVSLTESLSSTNHTELLKWVISQGYSYNIRDCFLAVLREGEANLMNWVKEMSYSWREGDFEQLMKHAYFETLVSAIENGCPWSEEEFWICVQNQTFEDSEIATKFAEWKLIDYIEGESEVEFYSSDEWIDEIVFEHQQKFGGSRFLN